MKVWMELLKKISDTAKQTYESIMDFCKRPLVFALITFCCLAIWFHVFNNPDSHLFRILRIKEMAFIMWQMILKLLGIFSKDFVIPVIGISGTLLAVAVPLTYDTIKDISYKYKSGSIRHKFFEAWEVKHTPFLLIVVLFLGVFILSFPSSVFTSIMAKVYFLIFLLMCFAIVRLFDLVRVYSWGSEKLLNKGINESFAILGKRKFCKNVYKKLKGYFTLVQNSFL